MKRTAPAAPRLLAMAAALASAVPLAACAAPGTGAAAGPPARPGGHAAAGHAAPGHAAPGHAAAGHAAAGHAAAGSAAPLTPAPRAEPRALPTGFIIGTVARNLAAFDRAIRHRANLRVMFVKMGGPYFPARAILANRRLGAQTVLELQPFGTTMAAIAAGSEDSWLQAVFDPAVARLHRIVTISFAPEMNGQWYSYGTGRATPADYVSAWRHIHGVVMSSPAGRYVTWMWQPSAIHFSTPSPVPWWPGSQYVDEIGLDGYYIVPTDDFDAIFAKTIRLLRSFTRKPILVGETSVGPLTADQGADIANLFAGIRRFHLRGLVWFNIPQNRGRYHQDWRHHGLQLGAGLDRRQAASAREPRLPLPPPARRQVRRPRTAPRRPRGGRSRRRR